MFIKLTRLKRVLTEEAEQKLQEFEEEVSLRDIKPPVDDEGRTAQWYEDMNMKVPEDLLLRTNNEDYLELDLEDDYNIIETVYYVNKNDIIEIEDVSKDDAYLGDTFLTLDNNITVNIKENINQVILSIFWYRKIINRVKKFFKLSK